MFLHFSKPNGCLLYYFFLKEGKDKVFIFYFFIYIVEWSSFEHDFVEEEKATELKEPSAELLAEAPTKSEHGNIVWKAKVNHF